MDPCATVKPGYHHAEYREHGEPIGLRTSARRDRHGMRVGQQQEGQKGQDHRLAPLSGAVAAICIKTEPGAEVCQSGAVRGYADGCWRYL